MGTGEVTRVVCLRVTSQRIVFVTVTTVVADSVTEMEITHVEVHTPNSVSDSADRTGQQSSVDSMTGEQRTSI